MIMTPHPGDKTLRLVDPKNNDRQVDTYSELARLSPVPAELVLKSRLSTSQVLVGADIIIDYASSASIEAACLRKPGITVELGVLRNYLIAANGTDYMEAPAKGLSELVLGHPEKLAEVIRRLLTPGGYAPQRERQEAEYIIPERGLILSKMVSAITDLLN